MKLINEREVLALIAALKAQPFVYARVRAQLDVPARPDELSLDEAAYRIGWQLALDAVEAGLKKGHHDG